jgi:hypothetical protein
MGRRVGRFPVIDGPDGKMLAPILIRIRQTLQIIGVIAGLLGGFGISYETYAVPHSPVAPKPTLGAVVPFDNQAEVHYVTHFQSALFDAALYSCLVAVALIPLGMAAAQRREL